jgi:cytidine deaminase
MNLLTFDINKTASKLADCDVRRARMIALAFNAKSGNLITTATNRVIRGCTDKFTIHAEDFLIYKLRKINAFDRFKKITMLVIRHAKEKGWTMAKPCSKCQDLIRQTKIFSVYYTNSDGQIEELKLNS